LNYLGIAARARLQQDPGGMTVREISRRIFQTLWRGVYREGGNPAKGSGKSGCGKEEQVRGYTTLEVEAQQPGPGCNRGKREGSDWLQIARPDRRRSVNLELRPDVKTPEVGKYNVIANARKLLIGNVLKRVTNSQAANLRRRAAKYLTGDGNPASFLALVGVSLASGTGIMTKEDEIEGVCQEIRQAVSKTSLLTSKKDEKEETRNWCLEDFVLGEALAKGCSAVVYTARRCQPVDSQQSDEYNLAIKMMFNYHAESNALTILRAMNREIVAARSVSLPQQLQEAAHQLGGGHMVKIPEHPNIVEIYTAFCDRVPGLPGADALYGDALPTRLNPMGCGRNMSLFLVMRRYDCSLREYLGDHSITARVSVVLFTQLLEGVSFLSHTGVAHRDLKSDNILIDLSGGVEFPRLVISDFGCCLADSRLKMKLPYTTFDTDKGGNPALMAPEVACAMPGTFTTINYAKSDLWTAGTIAYEIFGGCNPFYPSSDSPGLQSTKYRMEELPPAPDSTPPLLAKLINSLLYREVEYRPSPKQAATICQLYLWSPSTWTKTKVRVSSQDILQWLLTMTTKVLCESRWGNTDSALQEYQLVATFLTTTSLRDIKSSLAWIQDQIDG